MFLSKDKHKILFFKGRYKQDAEKDTDKKIATKLSKMSQTEKIATKLKIVDYALILSKNTKDCD